MEPAAYLDHLRRDGPALAAAARRAPGVAVPSCPAWDMTALVRHTGIIHRWVEELVRTSATERIKRAAIVAGAPDDAESVVDWYTEGLAALIGTLAGVGSDPARLVWNWFDDRPAPPQFWVRRMADETAVHRWDAEAAAGEAQPIATDLAVDGIEEFLTFVERWLPAKPVAGLNGSLHLHAIDTASGEGEWSLTLAPDQLLQRREHAKADAAVRGTASDLLLWVVGRKPAGDGNGLTVFGDHAIVDAWRQLEF